MKKTKAKNNSGITICDSIVMSVKKKSFDLRKAEAAAIAIAGFSAVILAFLGMFEFNYSESKLITAAVGFSLFYITLSIIEGKALWILTASVLVFAGCAYRSIGKITLGFKYAYNIIYKVSLDTKTDYYRHLKPLLEEEAVTTLFIFVIWLLALVIYFFTICRPNPILPLLVTFPIIEIGLYNGIEIPIFWGVIVVAYWLALLGMSTIDIGEYSGGTGGFVRKDDLFFPKRQMKLKVTEKCGVFIVAAVMAISIVTCTVIEMTDYERSDSINEKRQKISEAFSEFTFDDVSGSISNIMNAFGFDFSLDIGNNKSKSKTTKLGNTPSIKYKNTTDLIVSFDKYCLNSVYIRDDVKSVYKNNEWSDLSNKSYDPNLFGDFKKYGFYPQDLTSAFISYAMSGGGAYSVSANIESRLSGNSPFAPYHLIKDSSLDYDKDLIVSNGDGKKQSYRFFNISPDDLRDYTGHNTKYHINVNYGVEGDYADAFNDMIAKHSLNIDSNGNTMLDINSCFDISNVTLYNRSSEVLTALLIEEKYRDFVYDNYLDVPDTPEMDEVREAFSGILSSSYYYNTLSEKLDFLDTIRSELGYRNEYSLSPGKTPDTRDFVNYFLLENHKGYCVHFATAGVMLARMAGIPARYATGYIVAPGDFKNRDENGNYTIEVKDSRSHAWAEVYLDGFGWVPFEFTAGYAYNSTPDATSTTTTANTTTTTTTAATSQKITSNTSSTSNAGSTSAVTTAVSGKGKKGGISLPPSFGKHMKRVLAVVMPIAVFLALIFLRRLITLAVRKKRTHEGASSRKIVSAYEYTEKLLAELDLRRGNSAYMTFAEEAERKIGGVYLEKDELIRLTEITLRSGFGNTPPTKEELAECLATAKALSESIYKSSGTLHKLCMKYIKCLI